MNSFSGRKTLGCLIDILENNLARTRHGEADSLLHNPGFFVCAKASGFKSSEVVSFRSVLQQVEHPI
jgi:hypothetical protein